MAFCFVPSPLPSVQRPRPFAGSRRLRLPLLVGAVDRIAASGLSTRSLHTSPNVRLLSSPRLRLQPARGGRRPPPARWAMSASAAYRSRAPLGSRRPLWAISLSSSPSPIFIARPLASVASSRSGCPSSCLPMPALHAASSASLRRRPPSSRLLPRTARVPARRVFCVGGAIKSLAAMRL